MLGGEMLEDGADRGGRHGPQLLGGHGDAVPRLDHLRQHAQVTPLYPSVLDEPHRQVDTERLLALEAHVEEVDRLDDDLPDAHAYLRAGPDFRGVWLHALWRLLTRCRRPLRRPGP